MAVSLSNDPQWSPATREALLRAEGRIDALAKQAREENDEEMAVTLEAVAGAVLDVGAALCSSLADLTAVLSERPA